MQAILDFIMNLFDKIVELVMGILDRANVGKE